jgi:hypothetical protein
MKGVRFLAALSLFICLQQSAQACSTPGYVPPSNYELVQATPHIVVARSKAMLREQGDRGRYRMEMEVVENLKGTLPSISFTVEGFGGFAGRSDETSFRSARPGSAAACIAFSYRVGELYVLFLQPLSDGALRVDWTPYGRVNEEISSLDSPWLHTVRHYVRVGQYHHAAARQIALAALATGWVESWSNLPKAMQDDVANHFRRSPSNPKDPLASTLKAAFLIPWREGLPPDKARLERINRHLGGLVGRGGADALPIFHTLLDQPNWFAFSVPIKAMAKRHPVVAERLKAVQAEEIDSLRSNPDLLSGGLTAIDHARPSWRTPPSNGS